MDPTIIAAAAKQGMTITAAREQTALIGIVRVYHV
jgi:hypothetical protein